ncbi:uncharacterized protein LOC107045594 isoform X1 [Diachasma alloeum]|uniref:uncharacterized protein LOC107045594 isoform X1 n=1 Tax=Diachasma alloeum TaxID=454923 RepID=UPI0007384E37|nr:uncharacterized protein LOC107045594 isoform X1 [Diachasma alloeum]XP_028982469.1 uncharacterized protein LOC107045594 isoform X1 [Diachasma alloeum]XP_028982470.1 uncharacterized protein LOC107045594 isoform X1 [Diachasma alloeum]XP_028982471.1 uncharacterized protein LOC107045594 isoform X1 [Diachasma alloeum]
MNMPKVTTTPSMECECQLVPLSTEYAEGGETHSDPLLAAAGVTVPTAPAMIDSDDPPTYNFAVRRDLGIQQQPFLWRGADGAPTLAESSIIQAAQPTEVVVQRTTTIVKSPGDSSPTGATESTAAINHESMVSAASASTLDEYAPGAYTIVSTQPADEETKDSADSADSNESINTPPYPQHDNPLQIDTTIQLPDEQHDNAGGSIGDPPQCNTKLSTESPDGQTNDSIEPSRPVFTIRKQHDSSSESNDGELYSPSSTLVEGLLEADEPTAPPPSHSHSSCSTCSSILTCSSDVESVEENEEAYDVAVTQFYVPDEWRDRHSVAAVVSQLFNKMANMIPDGTFITVSGVRAQMFVCNRGHIMFVKDSLLGMFEDRVRRRHEALVEQKAGKL